MTETTHTPDETTATVDEYTARMDKMLNSLKEKSQSNRSHQVQRTWIWLGIGVVISAGLIYLALSISSNGFQGAFHALVK